MSGAAVAYQRLGWDNVLALGYAAEQLCLAAQWLTSDTVALDSGIRRSCDHLQRLLEHQALLPSGLISSIRQCLHRGREISQSREGEGGDGAHQAEELSGIILEVLDEVRRELNEHADQTSPQLRAA